MTQQTVWNADGNIVVDTRAAAAAAIAPLTPSMSRQVFDFVANRGAIGATDEEIAAALKMRDSTARAWRVELRDGGQVRDPTRRRRSCSGRLCVIWMVTGKSLS